MVYVHIDMVLGFFNPLKAELNPICHLLVLLGARHVFHISGLKVKAPVYIQKIFLNIYYINYGIIEKEFCGTSDIFILLLP
jgi:hypothetical protein